MKITSLLIIGLMSVLSAGCSVFGKSGVETAPYHVLNKHENFEVRHYDELVLVTTPMTEGFESQRAPFYRLFDYISGNNTTSSKIAMTAPVFLAKGDAQDDIRTMSFVLPKDMSAKAAPKPTDSMVMVEDIHDYTVAVVTFNGFFSEENIARHEEILKEWIAAKGFKIAGEAKAAGYNPPYTLPMFRRNEILIPIESPQ